MNRSTRVLALASLLATACAADAASGASASDEADAADASAPTRDRDEDAAPTASSLRDASVPTDAANASDAASYDASAPLTIFTIVLENQDYADIVGNAIDAPYIQSLIADYGLATNYHDSGTHPSLPNYLTMISGAPQYPGLIDS